jgi:hypothetical protein
MRSIQILGMIICSLCMGLPVTAFPQRSGSPKPGNPEEAYGSIRGTVLTEKGEPLEGATVYVLPSSNMRNEMRAQTDLNGNFVVSGIPQGRAYVSAFDEEQGYPYNFFSFFLMPGEEPKQINVSTKSRIDNVMIRFGAKAARLTLDIVDDAGRPIEDSAQLIFTRPDLPGNYKRSAGPNVSLLVPPVPFHLTVQVKGFKPWDYQNESGDNMLRPRSDEAVKLTAHLARE